MISKDYANSILNLICGVKNEIGLPSKLYLGLCGSAPDPITGAISGEPSASSYERQVVGGSSGEKYFEEAEGGEIKNNKELHFKVAQANYGLMKYFFLAPAPTGNAIMWGALNEGAGVEITKDKVPVFLKEQLKASIEVAENSTSE